MKAISNITIEPYTLWRVAPGNIRLSENASRGALSEVTIGVRIQGTVLGSLEFAVEMAKQTGTLGLDPISSWAGHWKIARPLNVGPKLGGFVETNYASGTNDPTGRRWSTFDQIYPSNHDKLGFDDQVGWRNIKQVRGGVSEAFGKKWTFTETYENFWLASGRDALYASSGAIIAQALDGAAGRHVGQEVDVWAKWGWKKVIELGFGYARFLAGAYLTRTTPGKDFNFPFAHLTYHFTQEKTN